LTYEDIDGDRLSINKQLYEMSAIDDKDDIVLHLEPTKSKSSNRVIPLSEVVMEEIERHKQLQKNLMKKYHYDNHGYLFTTSHGTLYYKRNVARALKRLYKRTGVPYHKFHAYRHTFGTNLSRVGTPIEVTSKLMGHASIDITAKYYINVEAERRRDAVEAITKFTAPSMEGPEDE
jgi:integrase